MLVLQLRLKFKTATSVILKYNKNILCYIQNRTKVHYYSLTTNKQTVLLAVMQPPVNENTIIQNKNPKINKHFSVNSEDPNLDCIELPGQDFNDVESIL